MKILGILLIGFGLVDLVGSYMGFDLWGTLGVTLPDIIWKYSAFIPLILGYFLFNLDGKGKDEQEKSESDAPA